MELNFLKPVQPSNPMLLTIAQNGSFSTDCYYCLSEGERSSQVLVNTISMSKITGVQHKDIVEDVESVIHDLAEVLGEDNVSNMFYSSEGYFVKQNGETIGLDVENVYYFTLEGLKYVVISMPCMTNMRKFELIQNVEEIQGLLEIY